MAYYFDINDDVRTVNYIYNNKGESSAGKTLILYNTNGMCYKMLCLIDGNRVGASVTGILSNDLPLKNKKSSYVIVATPNGEREIFELFAGDLMNTAACHSSFHSSAESAICEYSRIIAQMNYKHAYIKKYSVWRNEDKYIPLTHNTHV
jgi:hypothetical protein